MTDPDYPDYPSPAVNLCASVQRSFGTNPLATAAVINHLGSCMQACSFLVRGDLTGAAERISILKNKLDAIAKSAAAHAVLLTAIADMTIRTEDI